MLRTLNNYKIAFSKEETTYSILLAEYNESL